MKKKLTNLLCFLIIVFATNLISAQCNASFPDATRAAGSYPGEEILIQADYYSGDYTVIRNIAAGKKYTFRLEDGQSFNVYQKLTPDAADFTLLTPVNGEYTAINGTDFKFVGCPTLVNKKLFGTCVDCPTIPSSPSPMPVEVCNNAQSVTNFLRYQSNTPSTVSCYGTSKSVTPNLDNTSNLCGGNKDDDVWFRFTAPSSNIKMRFENVSPATIDIHPDARPSVSLSWGLVTSCSSPGCVISGTVGIPSDGSTKEFDLNLSSGTPYYLQIHSTDLRNTIFSRVYIFDMSLPPMPVELISFKAQQKNNTNHLTWQTASEKNNSHFDIERSATGQDNWLKIGTVKGNGNSQIMRDYSFIDNNPLSITTYYRLKQVDNDGSFEYSNVVSVTTKGGKFKINALSPNPTKDNLAIQFESNKNETVSVSVMDMTGRVVLTQNASATEGANFLNVNTAILSNGLYMVSLKNSESVILNKIVKQ